MTVAVRLVSPARLIRSGPNRRPRPVDLARLLRLADIAARYIIPVSCLPRSLALARFLQRRGVAATVRIGVRNAGDRLEAHAWVVVDGRVVNDDRDAVAQYAPLDESLSAHAIRPLTVDAIAAALECHGVAPLVAERLRALDASVRPAWADAVIDIAMAHAATDLGREAELRRAIAALDAAGVQPVLFKGAHLAYRDYARPDLRPRVDSDILICDGERARAEAHSALIALGYETRPQVGGEFLMTQRLYVKREHGRVRHAIDVHWRVANPQAFAGALSHDEIWRDAERLPALGPAARGPSGPHALLIACMHRVAHHANAECVIWLKDIDLIARRLASDDWIRFDALTRDRRVRAVCAESLARTAAMFDTPLPDFIATAGWTAESREPSAAYLQPTHSRIASVWMDIRSLSSWRARLALLREYALPPRVYMREVYAPGSAAPLGWLYARRLLTSLYR